MAVRKNYVLQLMEGYMQMTLCINDQDFPKLLDL